MFIYMAINYSIISEWKKIVTIKMCSNGKIKNKF